MLDNAQVLKLRKEFRELLYDYNGKDKIVFNYEKGYLENLIFEEKIDNEGNKYRTFAFEFELLKKLILVE